MHENIESIKAAEPPNNPKGVEELRAHGIDRLPLRVERFLRLVALNTPEPILLNELRLISWAVGCIMGAETLDEAKDFKLPSANEEV